MVRWLCRRSGGSAGSSADDQVALQTVRGVVDGQGVLQMVRWFCRSPGGSADGLVVMKIASSFCRR